VYRRREGRWFRRLPWYFLFVTVVFIYTTIANVVEKPDGIKIAAFFILQSFRDDAWIFVNNARSKPFSAEQWSLRFLHHFRNWLRYEFRVPLRGSFTLGAFQQLKSCHGSRFVCLCTLSL